MVGGERRKAAEEHTDYFNTIGKKENNNYY